MRGIVNKKTVPLFPERWQLRKRMVPLCLSMICFESHSPIPVPLLLPVAKGLNIRARTLVGIPCLAGHYYQNALGDLPRAIATFQLGIHTYPLDFTNYVKLGIAYGNSGQMEEYLSQFVKAARVNPHAAVAQLDILGAQLTLDRIEDARRTMINIKRLGFDDGTTYFLRDVLIFNFLNGDRAGMRKQSPGPKEESTHFR
jgi:hypothetical protein